MIIITQEGCRKRRLADGEGAEMGRDGWHIDFVLGLGLHADGR